MEKKYDYVIMITYYQPSFRYFKRGNIFQSININSVSTFSVSIKCSPEVNILYGKVFGVKLGPFSFWCEIPSFFCGRSYGPEADLWVDGRLGWGSWSLNYDCLTSFNKPLEACWCLLFNGLWPSALRAWLLSRSATMCIKCLFYFLTFFVIFTCINI